AHPEAGPLVTAASSAAGGPIAGPSPLRRPEFRRLLGISITVALGFGMVIPTLPLFASSFGVGLAAIGLVQLVFGLTHFSFGIVAGLVVDRFGDRACTMAGLLIVSLSSYAMGFSETFVQLVLARGFGGAGSALFIAGLMNRILRLIEPEAMGRATGAFRSSFLVGIAAGPVMGGVVAKYLGLVWVFHIYASGLIVATVIAWFVMRGQRVVVIQDRKTPLDALRAAKPLFGDIRYVVALLATLVGWWTLSGPTQIVGTIYAKQELGFSLEQIGLALTLVAIGEVLVLFVAGRATDRFGRRAVLVPALAVSALGVAALGQIEGIPWAFYPLMLLIGTGTAAGGTAAGGLLADSIPEGGSGTAVGVNQMAGDLGYLIAPTAVGFVAETQGFPLAYLLAAVPAVVVFVAALKLPRGIVAATREQPPEPGIPVA
ncbi:MAG TPA: MFS transporter, partial [Actinomycetota bacterium]|nr:MFS transporter [Actinomycetota bacterium]